MKRHRRCEMNKEKYKSEKKNEQMLNASIEKNGESTR